MTDAQSTGNATFIKASEDVKKFTSKPTDDELLKLYALFKQGINGDNDTAAPGMFDFKAKYKWNAWNDLKRMSKEDAQAEYIKLVEELKPKYN
ncbi:uncharacterized protein VTP21DRAFT_8735 [Calcarisporiella thermophila]|uniref:uncharacterized protein n=1 Tax=Calcarisporiella thermophila TaxID=911321 RepID=UPI0037431218